MRILLGARLPDSALEAWSHQFVHDPEPFYLLDSDLALLPQAIAPLTRKAFNQSLPDGPGWLDIYTPWCVTQEAQLVWPATTKAFRQLSPTQQQALSLRQLALGRGNLWAWDWVQRVLTPFPEALQALAADRFESPEGVKLALRHDAWWALPEGARAAWLIAFAEGEAAGTCHSALLSTDVWGRFPALRALAGTFAEQNGPNCFATSLAVLQPDPEQALATAARWLWADEFEATLLAMGYRRVSVGDTAAGTRPDEATLPPGSVVAWADQSGALQHAFTVLGEGLCLNKQSQCWWAPRQVLSISTLAQNWTADGFTPVLFQAASR